MTLQELFDDCVNVSSESLSLDDRRGIGAAILIVAKVSLGIGEFGADSDADSEAMNTTLTPFQLQTLLLIFYQVADRLIQELEASPLPQLAPGGDA